MSVLDSPRFVFLAVTTSIIVSLLSEFLRAEKLTQSEINSSKWTDVAAIQIQEMFSILKSEELALANPDDYPRHYETEDNEEFDFIIVGAGSAGSVVANRLSEITGWKILLLEAGGDPTKTSEVPALFPFLQKTEIDWQYKSNPDEDNCLGMIGEMCNLPRGRVLGGSSTINYMLYVRGNTKDYDGWAAEGNEGWGYKDVLPYFKKSEDMRDKLIQNSSDFGYYHNLGGPLTVEEWPNKHIRPIAQRFAEGMEELGYTAFRDVNGPSQTGYVEFQGTLKDGKRCGAAKAFLIPARHRTNLKLSKKSLVTKVLFDSGNIAYGVEFRDEKGRTKTVRAKKEIILSAGAINTPQILMLSGLGPKDHLTEFDIPVIKDLSVGKNLQDHPLMMGIMMSLDFEIPKYNQKPNILDFLLTNDSLYSSFGMGSFGTILNSETGTKGDPDLELFTIDFGKNDTAKLLKFLDITNIKEDNKKDYLKIINDSSFVLLFLNSLLTPVSSGIVELQSKDPTQYPKITTGYYKIQKDINAQLGAYDFLYHLVETEGLKSVNAKIHEIKIPNCMKFGFMSKEYRECALRHLTSTTYHQCCTCRMGPTDSPDSVIDPELKVKGVKGLRVIDASSIPRIPRANTNAPVTMLAEKGSDLIKHSWLSKTPAGN